MRDYLKRHWRDILTLLIALSAVIGVWLGTVASIENGRQNAADDAENRARDAETSAQADINAALIECINAFAGDISERSRKLGEASERVSRAESVRDRNQRELFAFIAASQADPDNADQAEGLRIFTATLDALNNLVAAQDNLEETRDAYPVPEPPSADSCDLPE